jgi:hypothetical protein
VQSETQPLSAKIPSRIARLEQLAYNFWWSWHREARDLFKMLDYPLWRSTGHNPVKILEDVSQGRLEELAARLNQGREQPLTPEALFALSGVRGEWLEVMFGRLTARFGSVEAYLAEALGVGAAESAILRALYLEPAAG